ncbi:unnamed protein product [Orchesella dallaii]|uniref:Symplekin n=1 Tax=Orchesella dallaii TaxID=48710 RepID=A0ABP1QCM5_9HEXA
MIKGMRNYERILAVAAPEDVGLKVRLQELKVKSFSRDLIQVLPTLDEQGLDVVLPFVIELFQNPETRVLAAWNIFLPFSQKVGRKKSIEYLLHPILQIYEADYHSEKHLKLFHRTFILQLCSCFGLKKFIDNFPTLLIEAIGGWKAPGDNEELAPRAHLTSTDLEIEILEMEVAEGISEDKNKTKGISDKFRRMESEQGDAAIASVEPEMFLMEPDASDSEEKDGSGQGSGDLYGDCFIEHQYLPYCLEVVSCGIRKLNVAIEAAILGVSALLEQIFNYVSATFLVSQLKDPIISAILTPLCRMVCTEDVASPSGSASVSILASKIAGMMYAIRKKIGQDLSKNNLKPLLSTITTETKMNEE